jgi:CoA:oxalate CoA-transferase
MEPPPEVKRLAELIAEGRGKAPAEGAPLAQLGAGQNAFVAAMTALMYAEDTGQGQHIDLAIAEYATNVLENALMQYSYSGQEYSRVGNRGYGRAAWGLYPGGDGYVGSIAGPDQNWPEVTDIMEREELADPRYASRQGRLLYADEVDALMLPWLLDHNKVDIFKAGQEHGLYALDDGGAPYGGITLEEQHRDRDQCDQCDALCEEERPDERGIDIGPEDRAAEQEEPRDQQQRGGDDDEGGRFGREGGRIRDPPDHEHEDVNGREHGDR